ncbi:MAG: DUF362 domain-containing protein [Victivallales bacterium]|nr:DUF362 domain-containing protein [Victivallales bacterium]
MDRRDFLKTAAAAGLGGIAFSMLGNSVTPQKTQGKTDLVAVRGGTPVEMFDRGIAELGGMEAFVRKGQKVVVKPNIGWAKAPEYGADTNPELVARIIESCFKAGAGSVTVFDHTCNEWKSCYKLSGIAEAATKAKATVASGNEKGDYITVAVPGRRLTSAEVHKRIINCDVFINVPILKNHGGAKMTSAMKNLMGIVWDRRFFHKNDLQQCIADICTYRKPDLNIVDAYRVMISRGPRGVSLDDVTRMDYQLLSTDIVAIDTAAAKIIGYKPENIPCLKYGQELKLGTTDLDRLNIKRINLKSA